MSQANPPILAGAEVVKVAVFSQNPDGSYSPESGGDVNVSEINGATPALSNPLPVELSDGTNAFGTPTNPLNVLDGDLANVGTSLPTAVTNGQRVTPMADKFGRQVTITNGHRQMLGTASVNSSAASGATLIAAGASGVFTDIVSLVITNESSTATVVSITDGTTTYKFALAANGGIVINFPTPLPAASSATAWTCGNSATVPCDFVVVYLNNK